MRFNIFLFIKIVIITIVIIIIQSCIKDSKKNNIHEIEKKIDSTFFWIKASKNPSLSIDKRKLLLLKSYKKIKSNKIRADQIKNLSAIAYQYFKLEDIKLFKEINEESLSIAKKIKDSFAIGDVHWNYASYYNKIEKYDSAYHHFYIANNFFDKSGFQYEAAKTLYGMAYIKGHFKDYYGSEIFTFKAINKFKKLNDFKSLYYCYNHLALLQNDIFEYDRALFYHNKALEFIKRLNDNQNLYNASLNNIGLTYIKKGNYKKALDYFNQELNNDSLKFNNINSYAIVIDNKGYCKLLMRDTSNVLNCLKESLKIRDSLNNKGGIVISKIHLSRYYSFVKDTIKAIKYAKEASELAKEIKNSRDYLESLTLLSKFDKENAKSYLEKKIKISDSLQVEERKIQNKFTRIDYETDEYIEETKRLSQQKILILVISIGLLFILILLYLIKIQESKKEQLIFENEQQKANEQVYLLTLRRQEKLEREKIEERNRISEELHDGILGKLFGARMGLGFLNIEGDEYVKNKYQNYLEELQSIEKQIRDVSHKLNDNFDSLKIDFLEIINKLFERKSEIGGFDFEILLEDNIDWQKINDKIKVNLYRITQEALQNIIKHSYAKNVMVKFLFRNKKIQMIIIDDGIGFNIKRKKSGIGINNMKSRVEKLDGEFNINSIPEKGTKIEIQITLK